MISAEKARELLDNATEGPWVADAGWNLVRRTPTSRPLAETFLTRAEGDSHLIAAAPELAQTVIELTEQIDEARETVNDLHAFGLLQTPEADLLLLHLKDQP